MIGRRQAAIASKLRGFQLSERFRLIQLNVATWTWSILSRSYLVRVLCRAIDRDSVGCQEFHKISYTEHKLVTGKLDLDITHRQGFGYWKLINVLSRQDNFQREK